MSENHISCVLLNHALHVHGEDTFKVLGWCVYIIIWHQVHLGLWSNMESIIGQHICPSHVAFSHTKGQKYNRTQMSWPGHLCAIVLLPLRIVNNHLNMLAFLCCDCTLNGFTMKKVLRHIGPSHAVYPPQIFKKKKKEFNKLLKEILLNFLAQVMSIGWVDNMTWADTFSMGQLAHL